MKYLCANFIGLVASILLPLALSLSVNAQKPKASPTPESKESLFFEAIENSDLPTVQKLIASGIKVREIKDFGDQTPLLVAADHAFDTDGLKILQAIIDAGADLEVDGASALHNAARSGDIEAIKTLVKAGVDIKSRDEEGQTCLFGASTENMNYLIGLGLDPNDRDAKHRTPLFETPESEQVSVLLGAGAKVNVVDDDGDTPLIKAAAMGNTEVIQLLLSAGADINA